jgi:uracil-DNA glycosylase family 4
MTIDELNSELIGCRRCPRLVAWREAVAKEKRRMFAEESYWGRPVPYFGDKNADRLIVGLAPAAHGANRTGRMFTGDRSGDFLFAALYRAGIATQPASIDVHDGLALNGVLIAATAHCAPPANKPTQEEIDNCGYFLRSLIESKSWKSVLCLGSIAWRQVFKLLGEKMPPFGHGAVYNAPKGIRIVASYHPSQQNTFTGRLTPAMMDDAIGLWLLNSGS